MDNNNNLQFYSPIQLGSTIINTNNIETDNVDTQTATIENATIGNATIGNITIDSDRNIQNVNRITATKSSFNSIEVGSNALNDDGIQTEQITVGDANTNENVSIKSGDITGTGDLSFGNITATQQINANKIIINDTITIGNKSDIIIISNKGIEGLTDLSFDQLNTNPTLTKIKRDEKILDKENTSPNLTSLTNDEINKCVVPLRIKTNNKSGVEATWEYYPLYLYKNNNFVTICFSAAIKEEYLKLTAKNVLCTIPSEFRPKKSIFFSSVGARTEDGSRTDTYDNMTFELNSNGEIFCINFAQNTSGEGMLVSVGFSVVYYQEQKQNEMKQVTKTETHSYTKTEESIIKLSYYLVNGTAIQTYLNVDISKLSSGFLNNYSSNNSLIIRASSQQEQTNFTFTGASVSFVESYLYYYNYSDGTIEYDSNSGLYFVKIPALYIITKINSQIEQMEYDNYDNNTKIIKYTLSGNFSIPENLQFDFSYHYYTENNSIEYIQHFTESE